MLEHLRMLVFLLLLLLSLDQGYLDKWILMFRGNGCYPYSIKQNSCLPITSSACSKNYYTSNIRGPAFTNPIVYSSSEFLNINLLGIQLFIFPTSDFNVPVPPSCLIAYTASIGSNLLGAVRVGLESFNGVTYPD